MEQGAELLDLSRFDEAETAFRAVLRLKPDQIQAHIRLGLIARRRGDPAAAIACFKQGLEAHPKDLWARLELAQSLMDATRLEEAEAVCRSILADHPGRADASLRLGQVMRRQGDREAAIGVFREALNRNPADIPLRLELAVDLLETRRLEEAEAVCRAVLAQAPAEIGAYVRLAQIARRRSDRAAAMRHIEAALAVNPGSLWAKLEHAAELRDAGRFEEARQLIGAILESDPRNLQAWITRGQIHRHQGDRVAALKAFESALALHPNSAWVLVEIAQEERALGRPAEARRRLEEALERQPEDFGALMQLAELASWAEDMEASLDYCRRAKAARPDQAWAYAVESRILANLGEWPEAEEGLRLAIGRFGPLPELVSQRVELLRLKGEIHAARAVLREAGASLAPNFHVWATSVGFDIMMGDFEAAAAALRTPPGGSWQDRSRIEMLRGQLADAQWKLEEALAHYDEARRLNPNDSFSHHEAARVCLLQLDLEGARAHLRRWVDSNTAARTLRGESPNISQTHVGQLIDEFALDREALQQLRALGNQPAAVRIERLRAMVRRDPGHTASAISLLLALRQAGLFGGLEERLRRSGPSGGIPRRIVQFWAQPTPDPHLLPLMRGWQEKNPDYAYICFNDATASAFLQAHCSPEVVSAFRRSRHPAQRADIFRLVYLLVEGGVYADADDRCLAHLSAILPGDATFVGYQEEYATLGNNFLAAAPGHPVIETAVGHVVEAINRGDADLLWLSTGPGLITRAFAQCLAGTKLQPGSWLSQLCILERGEVRRAIAMHTAMPYKRTKDSWLRSVFASNKARTTKNIVRR